MIIDIARYAGVMLVGYLLGSIPFGLLISRRSTGTDLRQVGSGKTGMTNVLRTAGRKAAALALILDMGKGALAVILAMLICGDNYYIAQVVAALAAIAGHSWSIFLKFRGGRGVATFIGGLLAIYWPAAVVGGGIMLMVGFGTRYMSLGSISGAVAAFVMSIILTFTKQYPAEYVIYTMICAIFIFVMHRDNIFRLMSGTERRIGDKAVANSPPSSSRDK